MLRSINLEGLKPPSKGDEELIFQVNDPNSIHSQPVGIDGLSFDQDTLRKPDATAMPLRASGMTEDWESYRRNRAQTKPRKGFPLTWFDCRMAVEFKKSVDYMELPPSIWEPCDAPNTSDPFLKPGIAPIMEDELITPALPVVSEAHVDFPSAPAVLMNKPKSNLGSSSRTNAVGRKRQSDDDQRDTSSKKAKHHKEPTLNQRSYSEKNRRLNGAVQLSIYAGERISSSIVISHSWNLLIRGQLHSRTVSDALFSSFRRRPAVHLRFRPVQGLARTGDQLRSRFPGLRRSPVYPSAL
jgi:hypothetical protein